MNRIGRKNLAGVFKCFKSPAFKTVGFLRLENLRNENKIHRRRRPSKIQPRITKA